MGELRMPRPLAQVDTFNFDTCNPGFHSCLEDSWRAVGSESKFNVIDYSPSIKLCFNLLVHFAYASGVLDFYLLYDGASAATEEGGRR